MMSFFDFFDHFREMAMADPWHFILLAIASGVVGLALGKKHAAQQVAAAKQQVATANQHVALLKEKLLSNLPEEDRELERKRIERDLKKQDRLLDKQRRR